MARDWTERLARHRTGLVVLSFVESTVLPIPLETVVAPLMVGQHRHSLGIATAIWIGCLGGAVLFYLLGYWLSDPVVRPAMAWLGLTDGFDRMASALQGERLFWTVFLVSFSPAPMQFATLGAGAVQGNFLVFLTAIAGSRGIRYFGLALLARTFGPRIAEFNIPTGRLIAAAAGLAIVIWAASI